MVSSRSKFAPVVIVSLLIIGTALVSSTVYEKTRECGLSVSGSQRQQTINHIVPGTRMVLRAAKNIYKGDKIGPNDTEWVSVHSASISPDNIINKFDRYLTAARNIGAAKRLSPLDFEENPTAPGLGYNSNTINFLRYQTPNEVVLQQPQIARKKLLELQNVPLKTSSIELVTTPAGRALLFGFVLLGDKLFPLEEWPTCTALECVNSLWYAFLWAIFCGQIVSRVVVNPRKDNYKVFQDIFDLSSFQILVTVPLTALSNLLGHTRHEEHGYLQDLVLDETTRQTPHFSSSTEERDEPPMTAPNTVTTESPSSPLDEGEFLKTADRENDLQENVNQMRK